MTITLYFFDDRPALLVHSRIKHPDSLINPHGVVAELADLVLQELDVVNAQFHLLGIEKLHRKPTMRDLIRGVGVLVRHCRRRNADAPQRELDELGTLSRCLVLLATFLEWAIRTNKDFCEIDLAGLVG